MSEQQTQPADATFAEHRRVLETLLECVGYGVPDLPSLDPLAAMAEANVGALDALLQDVQTGKDIIAIRALLARDEAIGYQRSSRDAYLNRLTAKELVESVGRGEVRAAAELFD